MKPKVVQISETLFEIQELKHSVKIQTKKGRTLLICDCRNDTLFCTESPFCYHKQLVVEFLATKKIREALNQLIIYYEGQKQINLPQKPEVILDDLNRLMRVING